MNMMLSSAESVENSELLYFWGIGDLHYRLLPAWNELHTQRLTRMFQDLHALWQTEGTPAFCVSPGDVVETCAEKNHQLARTSLETQLGNIPFYPGLGNHEYYSYGPDGGDSTHSTEIYSLVWEKPLCYAWTVGEVVCIMLDYPNPFSLPDPEFVFVSQETLEFLDTTLAEHAGHLAVIFLHCPLYNTVLDRDPEHYRDYNSLQHFFAPENSQAIRDILARHSHACLYFSGHTHTGWEAPNIVYTEQLGNHPLTSVNLMSPWYTGTHTGPQVNYETLTVNYIPDDPDVIPSFAVHIYRSYAIIRIRDSNTRQWLREWNVPLA